MSSKRKGRHGTSVEGHSMSYIRVTSSIVNVSQSAEVNSCITVLWVIVQAIGLAGPGQLWVVLRARRNLVLNAKEMHKMINILSEKRSLIESNVERREWNSTLVIAWVSLGLILLMAGFIRWHRRCRKIMDIESKVSHRAVKPPREDGVLDFIGHNSSSLQLFTISLLGRGHLHLHLVRNDAEYISLDISN
ncbi:hypothetical protein EDD18DRAFT_1109085 [Armillaria luteobubalina]|uniref:Uncharacterized protein n=1 Tax=Armillaria luteobubalina TaxID=153913 RepID=A0AA39Q057_9AGAR|nr:hypothetical protein EDD18DRAFT_1109085 [Armillaria luteobubalina]